MGANGLRARLGRTFLLQAAFISVAAVIGVFLASVLLEAVLIRQALREEASHFWAQRSMDPAFPLPGTKNLTGYIGDVPLPLIELAPGYHERRDDGIETVVYVTDRDDQRLYLVFDRSGVGHGAGQHPDRVEGRSQGHDPGGRESADLGLPAHHPAERRRDPHRAPRVRAQADRGDPRGHQGAHPATRPSGDAGPIVGVHRAGALGMAGGDPPGELVGPGPGDHHGPRGPQGGDHRGVVVDRCFPPRGPHPAARRPLVTGHVDQLLDHEGDAVQRAPVVPGLQLLGQPTGVLDGGLHDLDDRTQLSADRPGPGQAVGHHRRRGERSVPVVPGEVGDRQ